MTSFLRRGKLERPFISLSDLLFGSAAWRILTTRNDDAAQPFLPCLLAAARCHVWGGTSTSSSTE